MRRWDGIEVSVWNKDHLSLLSLAILWLISSSSRRSPSLPPDKIVVHTTSALPLPLSTDRFRSDALLGIFVRHFGDRVEPLLAHGTRVARCSPFADAAEAEQVAAAVETASPLDALVANDAFSLVIFLLLFFLFSSHYHYCCCR